MSAHRHLNQKKTVRQILRTTFITTAFCGFTAMSALAGAPGEEVADDRIQVQKDFTRTLNLEQGISGVVIGNPGIADVSLRNNMSLFVHGRSPGLTNMLVYDEEGELIDEFVIQVSAAQDYLTLRKGAGVREHYDCVGRCERVMRMDDDIDSATKQASNVGTSMGLMKGIPPTTIAPDKGKSKGK